MIKEWLAVGLGGMLGAIARHWLCHLFSLAGPNWLPFATLTANILGCLAIGVLFQWSAQQTIQNDWWVVAIRVGLLGGLTTFSSFALEIARFMQSERFGTAIGLVFAHVVIGITATIIGLRWGAELAASPNT
ncbi:MAG: fluoride efflux transporter CrcB [Pirellulaceae bacterium]